MKISTPTSRDVWEALRGVGGLPPPTSNLKRAGNILALWTGKAPDARPKLVEKFVANKSQNTHFSKFFEKAFWKTPKHSKHLQCAKNEEKRQFCSFSVTYSCYFLEPCQGGGPDSPSQRLGEGSETPLPPHPPRDGLSLYHPPQNQTASRLSLATSDPPPYHCSGPPCGG